MNVFISYSHADTEFAHKLFNAIEQDGYNVFIDNKIPIGNNIYKDIGESITKADVVIVITSRNSLNSDFVANETFSILSLFEKGKLPLVIPIILGQDTKIPYEISRLNSIIIPYENEDNFYNYKDLKLDKKAEKAAIERVRLILSAHNAKIQSNEIERKKSEEKVKKSLADYIKGVFSNLQDKERKNKHIAFWLYLFSILSLLATIAIAFIFFTTNNISSTELVVLIVYGVVFLLVEIILISLSKLLFTLARSFMAEAIRSSDRIHAISFGKFFLDAYGDQATIEEVLKAFSSWNIDNPNTFGKQSGEDFDPKLIEILKLWKK